MTTKLFVYGTLVGTRNTATKATLKNAEKHTDSAYPTITPEQGSNVKGEIIEVNKSELETLDQYESEGRLYKRIPINREENIQAYIGNPEKLQTKASYSFDRKEMSENFKQNTELQIQN